MPVSGIPPPISGASASALALGQGYSVISSYPAPTEAVGIIHHLPAVTLNPSVIAKDPTTPFNPPAVTPAVPDIALPYFKPLLTRFTLSSGTIITCSENYIIHGTATPLQERDIPGQVQHCGQFDVVQGTRTAHLARFKDHHTAPGPALLPQTFFTSTRPAFTPPTPRSKVLPDGWMPGQIIPCGGTSPIDPASYPHDTNNFPLSDAIAAICIDSPHQDPSSDRPLAIFCLPTPPDSPITPNLIIAHHNNICAAAQSGNIPPVVQPAPSWKMRPHHPHGALPASFSSFLGPVSHDAVINPNDGGSDDQDNTLPSYGEVGDWLRKIINDKYEEYKRWNGKNMIELAGGYEDMGEGGGEEAFGPVWSVCYPAPERDGGEQEKEGEGEGDEEKKGRGSEVVCFAAGRNGSGKVGVMV